MKVGLRGELCRATNAKTGVTSQYRDSGCRSKFVTSTSSLMSRHLTRRRVIFSASVPRTWTHLAIRWERISQHREKVKSDDAYIKKNLLIAMFATNAGDASNQSAKTQVANVDRVAIPFWTKEKIGLLMASHA